MVSNFLKWGQREIFFLEEVLNAFGIPYLLFDQNKQLKIINLSNIKLDIDHPIVKKLVSNIFLTEKRESEIIRIDNDDQMDTQVVGIPIKIEDQLVAVIIVFQTKKFQFEDFKNMAIDLKTIFESSYDVLFVSDNKGNCIRVSAACKRLWGKEQEEFIGRNVFDLENEGVFNPSITRTVLEKKQKVSAIQKTCTGKTLLVLGTPVFDNSGNITRIINASRDITEIQQLQQELDEMHHLVEHYKKEIQSLNINNDAFPSKKIIYKSQEMDRVINQIKIISNYDIPVLIAGESGVGKEVVAALIHEWSERRQRPFIKVNCGAIPDSLLESELFGYEKGTFTGANKGGKKGIFLAANHGTILLDEVTEMPSPLQVKLLRVLQENEILPLGSTKPVKINVRIISATNKDIYQLINTGTFREDLFYRLNGITLEIPPLRTRKADIEPLVKYFVSDFNNHYHESKKITKEGINELIKQEWKGNVRELKNFVERLLILSPKKEIDRSYVLYSLGQLVKLNKNFIFEINDDVDFYETLEYIEKQILTYAANKYNKTTEIAESLNISQPTVSKKLKKHQISLVSGLD